VVQAESIAMHTLEGFSDITDTFFVKIPKSLDLKEQIGKKIMFNGDVTPRKDGYYLRMNRNYGGGVITGDKYIQEAKERIESGQEPWYNDSTLYLKGCMEMASKEGVNTESWQDLWSWMIHYYAEYIPSLREKGTVKAKAFGS
jgi:hypothetical protein